MNHAPHIAEISPGDPLNISTFIAFELTHASPQSTCSNELAPSNIEYMLVTSETSHLDKSWLKAFEL